MSDVAGWAGATAGIARFDRCDWLGAVVFSDSNDLAAGIERRESRFSPGLSASSGEAAAGIERRESARFIDGRGGARRVSFALMGSSGLAAGMLRCESRFCGAGDASAVCSTGSSNSVGFAPSAAATGSSGTAGFESNSMESADSSN